MQVLYASAGFVCVCGLWQSPHCPLCKDLIPIAKNFARREKLDIVFVGDDDPSEQQAMIARLEMGGMPFVNGPMVGRVFHVDLARNVAVRRRDLRLATAMLSPT